MEIEGSVVLVTGGNRGLGAEYVRQLLDRGLQRFMPVLAILKPSTP